MAKISAEEVSKRRAFALERWRDDPYLSVPKMNELLKKEFRGQMNTQQLYKIRNGLWKELEIDENSVKERAAGGKKKGPQLEAFRRQSSPVANTDTAEAPIVVVMNDPKVRELIKFIVDQLNHRGWAALSADFTPKYALIHP